MLTYNPWDETTIMGYIGIIGLHCYIGVLEKKPLNRDYNRDPNIKAFKRRGFINHWSTLVQPAKITAGAKQQQIEKNAL